MMETAAAQCLLLAAVFRRADAGIATTSAGTRALRASFFSRAALRKPLRHKAQLAQRAFPGASSRWRKRHGAPRPGAARQAYLLKSTPSLM